MLLHRQLAGPKTPCTFATITLQHWRAGSQAPRARCQHAISGSGWVACPSSPVYPPIMLLTLHAMAACWSPHQTVSPRTLCNARQHSIRYNDTQRIVRNFSPCPGCLLGPCVHDLKAQPRPNWACKRAITWQRATRCMHGWAMKAPMSSTAMPCHLCRASSHITPTQPCDYVMALNQTSASSQTCGLCTSQAGLQGWWH